MNRSGRLFRTIILVPFICLGAIVYVRRTQVPQQRGRLSDARLGFHTHLTPQRALREAPDKPPVSLFHLVHYPAASGSLAAYLTPDPKDGTKRPAIVWITGGDCNSIGDVWSSQPRGNDQSAAQYRQAGIVLMFPSLRGGNINPGVKEGFLGEVDDVLAATKYLEKISYVDPKRIYLGGHSTGGTLAMLIAECSTRYRAVIAFGPVSDISHYDAATGFTPFDLTDPRELLLRSPGYWLSSIHSPIWAFEGAKRGNIKDLTQVPQLRWFWTRI